MPSASSSSQLPPIPRPPQEDKSRIQKERNRKAASKCREKKKTWIEGMTKKVEVLETRNTELEGEVRSLREKMWQMSLLLLNHPEDPQIVDYLRSNPPVTTTAAAPAAASPSNGAANATAATMPSTGAAVAATFTPEAATPMSAASFVPGVPAADSNLFNTAPFQPQGELPFNFNLPDVGSTSLGVMDPSAMTSQEDFLASGPDYSGNGLSNNLEYMFLNDPSDQQY